MFTDSIEHNLALIEELVQALPLGERNAAKRAAVNMEKVFKDIQRDNQSSKGAAVGTAFAVFTLAKRLTDPSKGSTGGNLIQLLS
jgi:hypothetical protein